MKMKNIKKLLLFAALSLLVCVGIVFAVTHTRDNAEAEMQETLETEIYANLTWEEYQSLSLEEQDRYFDQFASKDDFESWMDAVKPTESVPSLPKWDESGKCPDAYTWEEYQRLTGEERDAFVNWFESAAAFEAWLESVKSTESTEAAPEWGKQEKLPSAYAWAEFQALTSEEKDTFFAWFGSLEAFEAWMNSVKPTQPTEPTPEWNKPGKLPNEYTWEEYQQLTKEEQDVFFHWFESVADFEAWMEKAQTEAPAEPAPEWNKPGKLPNKYTWEEYQVLTPEEQDAFFHWFGSINAFEAWMDSVKPTEPTESAAGWNKPGKLPNEYTWEEYQALTPEEQDAFFLWFGSVEAFEAWMDVAIGG